MQERAVDERHAARVEPSWYLCRDGQQFGPLTDRELSLFAEGGNFSPGDLLWTEGLDSWKPAGAVFGLAPSAAAEKSNPAQGSEDGSAPVNSGPADAVFELEPSPAAEPHVEPHGEDVAALVQALTGTAEPPKPTLTERVLAEAKKFAGIFTYLWVVFIVLLLHEWIVLSQNHIGFGFYGVAAINALILAKIMLVAEHFGFAEKLKEKPLIYPIAYKTIAFTTLLFAAYIVEAMLVGWFQGKGFLASVPSLGGSVLSGLALWLIFCVALLPYFAFKEMERAVGADLLRTLLLGPGTLLPRR
jgi:hypothetical protein